uniref:Putative gland protein G34B08 n=1 Tax=Heterodera glycines TaxID=51029 RepID=Q86DE6_HETGL|nr:putative gland protein G34B08 [Heterodera glycines]
MRTFLFIAVVGLMLAVILENVNATGKNSPTKGQSPPGSPKHEKDRKNEHGNQQNHATGKSPPGSPRVQSPPGSPRGKSPPGSPRVQSPPGSPRGQSPPGSPKHEKDHKNEHGNQQNHATVPNVVQKVEVHNQPTPSAAASHPVPPTPGNSPTAHDSHHTSPKVAHVAAAATLGHGRQECANVSCGDDVTEEMDRDDDKTVERAVGESPIGVSESSATDEDDSAAVSAYNKNNSSAAASASVADD